MTLLDQHVSVRTWTEPEGIATRGTLVVIPGRGEQPGHYERFGRRVATDGYRVHAVTDPGGRRRAYHGADIRPAGRYGDT